MNPKSRPSTQPISGADIAEYLSKHDDFALELRCAKALKERQWSFMHGGSYEDPVTKKTRQFDVRASKQIGKTQISLAVECKALRVSYPLVVSRHPRTKDESFHEVILCHAPEKNLVHVGVPRTTRNVRLSYQTTIYDYSTPVGKATVQIGRKDNGEIVSGDAETFEKWSQALASLSDMIMGSTELDKKSEAQPMSLHVALPILIVSDATLWAVDYSSSTLEPSTPKAIDETTVYVGKEYWQSLPSCSYTVSHLHIYTEKGFSEFLDGLSGMGRSWSPWFPSEAIGKVL